MSELVTGAPQSAQSEPTPQTSPAPASPEQFGSPAPSQQATSVAAPTPQPPQVEPSWLKSRLDETRQATLRQAQAHWAQQEANYKAQLEATQRQLHAIVGVTPQENPEVSAVRSQFNQLFPGLAKLEERANDLLSLAERSGESDAQVQHYWDEYARNRTTRLFTLASEGMGAPLTEEGKRVLHSAFTGYVSNNPDAAQRYMNDPSIVDEFWTYFGNSFIDPVRRSAQATVQSQTQNRALPQDSLSGAPQVAPVPRPANQDARMATAWAQYTNHPRG